MGIVVDLGLSRFEKEHWTGILDALVESGVTKLVRDVRRGKVYEARRHGKRVQGRFLDKVEAKPILKAWREVERRGSPSWSWDEFQDLGVECQTLELVFDIERTGRVGVQLPHTKGKTWVDDLRWTSRRWEDWDDRSNLVCWMQMAAIQHRLVVHNE